jgi:predicted metal-dependent hydrolase
MKPPRKRRIDEIATITDPSLSPEQRSWLDHGIELFNSGQPWHAHEEWEKLWLTMSDDKSGDAEILLRGLIQLAAGIHLLKPGREEGARSNFRKAREKLLLAPAVFLGIAIEPLVRYLEGQIEKLDGSVECRIER